MRCLLPMLVAMFLVLVGVVATPVVVFVLDGSGKLPLFGKKNETTVAELSLAAITQAATPKASGESGAPMNAPQEGIVGLTTPPRPKSSHGSPATPASGSRYHAAPHHKPDSKRERVYAPTVPGAGSSTTIGATAEVQALSEQVIVVPKGGVMSKLRAAGEGDARRKARHSKSSHSAENKLEHSGDNRVASTKATAKHTTTSLATEGNGTVAGASTDAITNSVSSSSGTTKGDSVRFHSVANPDSSREPLHSISLRHKRVARKKTDHRKRSKKSVTTRIAAKKRSTTLQSGTDEKQFVTSLTSKVPRRRNIQISNTFVSFELRRKRSTRSTGSARENAESTSPIRSSSPPPSQKEDASSALNSRIPVKFEDASSSTGAGIHGIHAESANVSDTTVRRVDAWAELRNLTQAPSIKGRTSYIVTVTSSLEPALRGTHSVADHVSDSTLPRSSEELKREKDTLVAGSGEHSTGGGSISVGMSERTKSPRGALKDVEGQTTSVGELENTSEVPIAALDASKTQHPNLLETAQPQSTSDRAFSDDWSSSLIVNGTLADKKPLTTGNSTVPNEQEKFVDFAAKRNERHDDYDTETTGDKSEKSELETANHNGELDSNSKVNGRSSLPQNLNFTSRVTSKMSESSYTQQYTTESEARHYIVSSSKETNLIHNESHLVSEVTAKGEVQENEILRESPPSLEVRRITPTTAETAAKRPATVVGANDFPVKSGSDVKSSTSRGLDEHSLENGSAGLVALEVNFGSRRNATAKTSNATTGALHSSQTILQASDRTPSKYTSARERGASHASPSMVSSSGHGIRPLQDDSVAHTTDGPSDKSTSHAANATHQIGRGGENSGTRGRTMTLDANDDGEEDDDTDDEESGTSPTSLSKANAMTPQPRIVLNFKGATSRTGKRRTSKYASTVTEQRRVVKGGSQHTNANSMYRSSEATKRYRPKGILHLGVTKDSATAFGNNITAKHGHPRTFVNKSDTVNNASPVSGVASERDRRLMKETLIALFQPPPSVNEAGGNAMSVSTSTAATSHGSDGDKQPSSINAGNEGSIWRTVLSPKNSSALVSRMTTSPDSGAGVESYYDDSKNDSSSSGSVEVDDSRGEPKTRNRRISGEISVTSKSSKKPDVFQTEYYYDDSPSRKAGETTTPDITEPGYDSVPDQEAIDDLFS